MLSALRTIRSPTRRATTQLRTAATQAQKRAGDISDAFASLSGQEFTPLTSEYADLKSRLIRGHESEVRESWERLLRTLRDEIPLIVEQGSKVIPEIDFKDIDHALVPLDPVDAKCAVLGRSLSVNQSKQHQ